MSFYKYILNHLFLPIGDTLFNGSYIKNIKEWKRLDAKSELELDQLQNVKLHNILNYAIKNVPFYNNQKSTELNTFPILTKSILRDQTNNLVSKKYTISKLNKHHSSGSSGEQSFTYMTKEHTFYLRALQTHWWTWSGFNIGDNLLQFGISQKRGGLKRFKDFFFRTTYIKAFGLSETELIRTLQKVSKKRNLYIAGYPSVINQLAETAIKNSSSVTINGVICFGDKLFSHYKKTIKKGFGNHISIIDTYGCAEGLLMACKHDLDYYYIMSPHVYIEIVDDNGKPVNDGEMGNVLVTSLTNYAMPLIRYKLGDLAIKLPKESYPEKKLLNYPLLQKVVGRETDIIKTINKITLNVHSFTGVFEYFQEIKQYKIIQNTLESIIIEYIADNKYVVDSTVLNRIKTKLEVLTKSDLKINFKKVDIIKPTNSGKLQIIESNLKSS